MKNILSDICKASQKNKEIISIYSGGDPDRFSVGYIKHVYKDALILHAFDNYGDDDGILLIRLEDINKIERQTAYLNKIRLLIDPEEFLRSASGTMCFDESNGSNDCGIYSVLVRCLDEGILLSLKLLFGDILTGYILEFDDEYLLLKIYTDDALEDGETLVKYEDISGISFYSKDHLAILKTKV